MILNGKKKKKRKYSQPSVFASLNLANHEWKIFGKNNARVPKTKFEFATNWKPCTQYLHYISYYFYSSYIVLGIVGDLEMI